MDSLTHIALGAAIGEATLGKRVGNKAIVYGALIGSIPDFDVVLTPLIEPTKALLFHRGISHSILVALLLIPLIAIALSKVEKSKKLLYKDWLLFTVLTYSSHIFIDCFNTYGTGILEPFSNYRVAYDTMSIIDIFFLFPLLILVISAYFIPYHKKIRRIMTLIGLSISAIVLLSSIINKEIITQRAIYQLKSQGLTYSRLITTPAPLTNFFWAAVAENDEGYYVGYLRNFHKNEKVGFSFIPRNADLIANIKDSEEIKTLKRFSKGFYTVEKDSLGGIWMHDLRYIGLDFEKGNSFVFTFGIKEKNGSVEIARAYPNRKINATSIRHYFEVVF